MHPLFPFFFSRLTLDPSFKQTVINIEKMSKNEMQFASYFY